ncbi:hypothetical protein BUALT_Bualt05G0156100 [Buddleja alternifolia]|uniref:Protein-S-isoprenylcysteine O-methyltransferase n=1 Tax=Buddleja alternifolia TaxID=168488 RepID=A0AAV6XS81_9LAMI|nr:hypothetical protein BUALT_Bualt05G0156100 [Buddleja alternifolia]
MTEIFTFTACRHLSQMFLAIIFFHSSEYILALAIHGKNNVTITSLLITKNYALAIVCSLIEYFVELYFFPGMKEHWSFSNTGLTMVVFGEIIRKLAIITAGRSFTHLIKRYHEEHHILVTNGVYKYIRHPSYCGFLLCQRIPYEEFFLRQFFGMEYEEYAAKTFSGIPFIK